MTELPQGTVGDVAFAEGKATMNEQWEGRGKEYFGVPIRIPDIDVVGPRLLVKPPKITDIHLASGIVIPEQAQDRVTQGLILIVGDGIVFEGDRWDGEKGHYVTPEGQKVTSRYQPGMEVLYAKYAGAEIELYGQQYIVINEADVRCILEKYKLQEDEA